MKNQAIVYRDLLRTKMAYCDFCLQETAHDTWSVLVEGSPYISTHCGNPQHEENAEIRFKEWYGITPDQSGEISRAGGLYSEAGRLLAKKYGHKYA